MEKFPNNLDTIVSNKKYLYFIHIGNSGGMYIKKKLFNQTPYVQWFGKGKVKYDHHPCAFTEPVVFHGSRNNSQSYISDTAFIDDRSLKFSVVRNPFDLYVALYFMSLEQIGQMTFDYFIKMTCCNPDFNQDINHGESFVLSRNFFYYQIFNDKSDCTCDVVLRTESLNEGLEKLSSYFNLSPNFEGSVNNPPKQWAEARKQRGAKKNRDYRSFYNDELREIVEIKRSKELLSFGYTFDGPDDKIIIDPCNIKYDYHNNALISH